MPAQRPPQETAGARLPGQLAADEHGSDDARAALPAAVGRAARRRRPGHAAVAGHAARSRRPCAWWSPVSCSAPGEHARPTSPRSAEPPPLRLVDRPGRPQRPHGRSARRTDADRPGPQHHPAGPGRRQRRRPADLRGGPLGLVHRPRRRGRPTSTGPTRTTPAGAPPRRPPPRRWPPRPRPACPSGSPRPTWCPAPRCARNARCASSATRPASRRTPRATSAAGDAARRSAASPWAAARAARPPAAGTSPATAQPADDYRNGAGYRSS